MSHSLPIHFLPIDPALDLRSDQEIEALIGTGYADREGSGLLVCVSRNWWHLAELEDAAKRLNSKSLDFLWGSAQTVVLETTAIADAIAAVVMVLAEASGGLDSLGSTWLLKLHQICARQSQRSIELPEKDQRSFMQVYLKADVKLDVDDESRGVDGEIVSYFSFLKSLFACLSECLLNGKHLLFYQVFP